MLNFGEWLSVLGLVGTALGIFIGIWVGRNNPRRTVLRYAVDEREVVASEDSLSRSGLSMQFRGSDIERVCRTYFALWAHSGDATRREDIASTAPLGLRLKDGDRVLAARVVTVSREEISAEVRVNDENDGVLITYEFLEKRDGFVIEVLHELHSAPQFHGSVLNATLDEQTALDLTPEARQRHALRFWSRFASPAWLVIFIATTTSAVVQLGVAASVIFTSIANGIPVFGPDENFLGGGGLLLVFAGTMIVGSSAVAWEIFRRVRRRVPASVVAIDRQEASDWIEHTAHLKNGSSTRVQVGDQLLHKMFGVGVVTGLKGHGPKLVLMVNFDEVGPKRLLAKVAPIEFLGTPGDDVDLVS